MVYGSTHASMPLNYPADSVNLSSATKGAPPSAFQRGQRRRMNVAALALSVMLPWGLFATLFAVMSSSYHYKQPTLAYSMVACGLLFTACVGACAADSLKKKYEGDPRRQPNWFVFVFLTCAIAWILAVVVGDINYVFNMQPYYDVLNLNTYLSVDVTKMRGQQLMDAGRAVFIEGTQLEVQKSIGFRNQRMYCVAPITKGNATLETYDFWAVGMDCCSGTQADFTCKDFNNPNARGGLRLMDDDQRAYYRLAVQQAEATYGIKATHPLFFEWMQDPILMVDSWQEQGLKNYLMGISAFFLLQAFLVASAAISFSKLGYS